MLLPLAFVSMMCFIFYTIVRSIVTDPEIVKDVIPIMLKIIFGIFLVIGYTFTAGMVAVTPMKEKKGGLRHMMHLFGLNSFEYFLGMAIADLIIAMIPATAACIIIMVFDEIMLLENVGEFWLCFVFFGCTMNCLSYLLTHLFSNPDTAVKYLSLVYSLGFFIGPLIVVSIVTGLMREPRPDECEDYEGRGKPPSDPGYNEFCEEPDTSFVDGFSFLFFFTPLCTFWLICQNLCYRGDEMLDRS